MSGMQEIEVVCVRSGEGEAFRNGVQTSGEAGGETAVGQKESIVVATKEQKASQGHAPRLDHLDGRRAPIIRRRFGRGPSAPALPAGTRPPLRQHGLLIIVGRIGVRVNRCGRSRHPAPDISRCRRPIPRAQAPLDLLAHHRLQTLGRQSRAQESRNQVHPNRSSAVPRFELIAKLKNVGEASVWAQEARERIRKT